jgi:hypothetical protein
MISAELLPRGNCLQDYRPGMTRADLDDEQRRQRVRDGLEAEAPARHSRRSFSGAPEFDDGSFPKSGKPASRSQCLQQWHLLMSAVSQRYKQQGIKQKRIAAMLTVEMP